MNLSCTSKLYNLSKFCKQFTNYVRCRMRTLPVYFVSPSSATSTNSNNYSFILVFAEVSNEKLFKKQLIFAQIYAAAKRQQQAITRQKRLSSVHNVTTPGNNGHAGEANGVGEGAGTGVSQNGGVSNGKTRRLTNSSPHFHVEESGGGGQIYETNRKDERGGFAAQW